MSLRVVSAILFSPRGGSAPVARALTAGLRELGLDVTLVAGSRSDLGEHGDAVAFYGEVQPVRFDAALASQEPQSFVGPAGTAPMHPSYEERPGAPDAVFAKLSDADLERQVVAWARELRRAGAADADVLHLHHLTPLNEAAARVAPRVPIVGQLHGTELLMLEQIEAGPPDGWPQAERWATRLRHWAAGCERLLVAPGGSERARSLLGVDRERLHELPNGVDITLFSPRQINRVDFWRETLLERPRGWLPGERAGSARYEADEVQRLRDGPVLLYVGRFTSVKRLPELIEAFTAAREAAGEAASLVLVGGHPGEWEGEHPAATVQRLGASGVFLAGWRSHHELPEFFAAADVVVSAAEREQFGQLLVEGMSCGLPAVAVRAMGPATIVEDGITGWLAEPGDPPALVQVLADALRDPVQRAGRGQAAREAVRSRYSWPAISERLGAVLEEAVTQRARHAPVQLRPAPKIAPPPR